MDWRYLLWLLDGFHGRIGRKPFWIGMLAVGAANMAACYAASQIQGDQLNAIVDLVFTYPEFAIATKRANDRNLPFWLLGVFFAASVMLDLFSVLGWAGSDASPSTLAYALAVPFTAFGIALLVELGFRKGTAGPNPHGPDPLAGAGRAS
ncbi:MAG TPA: DUF805 domain-containing protein [Xanthobacteraceae bacterium]|nr:DUF805 domain-containing protein [Xanthobacteraceae bacterium]